jgi:L-amino acid N-acyltransferase YncA
MRDSPHAFTSSYATESGWGELEWRRLFEAAKWIAACEAGKVIGLARSVSEPGRPATRHLESVWVAPTHRQRGVCRALLVALAEIECAIGASDLLLWVLEDNHDAQRAYAALGFVPTGKRQFLTTFERFEQQLTLGIRRLLDTHARPSRLTYPRIPRPPSDGSDSGLATSAGISSNSFISSVHEDDLVPTVKRPNRPVEIDLGLKPLSC